MNWVAREEMLKEMIIEIVNHAAIKKGISTVNADSALMAIRKIYFKWMRSV